MDFKDFQWVNGAQHNVTEDGIEIFAPKGSEYFVHPGNGDVNTSAPFFYQWVEGDFVLRARVSLAFVSTFDAGVLLAVDHDNLWAKACFERTDFDTHSVVTVMTNGLSDDANGYNVEGQEVWLQLARKDDIFATHYSLDGERYIMARLCNLPMQKRIKVGLEAQSPIGEGALIHFKDVSLELRGLEDIRGGNC
ncbi:DUF1349 domain-containing protein [Paenibacillus sp. FSL R10-2782]|uniref:DUF1349 domain-containing protein n=1 Tax=Paenibacillus sp. FSL R10-2782 TaxID=2954661 RepID=UPI0031594D95